MNSNRLNVMRLSALLAALSLAGGCSSVSTIRMYSGPILPNEKIAIVENHTDSKLVSVDHVRLAKGIRTHKGVSFRDVELLPGTRTINLVRKFPKDAFPSIRYKAIHKVSYGQHSLVFDAEAGHRYIIGEDIQVSPFYRWTPWMQDTASSERLETRTTPKKEGQRLSE